MTKRQSPPTALAASLAWVLVLTSTAYIMVILDTGALFAALPRMQRDLHANLAWLQWTANSYGIAFAAGILTAAALGDRFGRRRVFRPGLTPLARALSDRVGRRTIMVTGLALQALGFAWVPARGSLHPSWIRPVIALLVAGIRIAIALPTPPTAVLHSVAETELGKAPGRNFIGQTSY